MDKKSQIRQGLKKLAAEHGPLQTMLVQVTSVNEDEFICNVIDDDVEIFDVRLRPVLNGNTGIVLIPTLQSWVLITRIEEDQEWCVIGVDEVDKVIMVVGECRFEINDGFLIKKGTETLKKIFDDLIAQIKLIVVPTNVGPSGNPLNGTAFDAIKTRADNLLK